MHLYLKAYDFCTFFLVAIGGLIGFCHETNDHKIRVLSKVLQISW